MNVLAIIIGNNDYPDPNKLTNAVADATAMFDVFQRLGYHTIPFYNFHQADIPQIMETIESELPRYDASIFYYAGHGIPNESDKSAYLLPVDGIGSDIESAYPLNKLYQTLSELPAQSVTIFLDACFSGTKRDGEMMASARGVAIKAKPEQPKGKMVIFTAAQGDETAYPFKSQQHGMFTYYLLKKLQDSKGNVTLGELGDYLTKEVKRQSFDENSKMQTPTVNASAAFTGTWREMKLK
jgi:uncharacterized caspase-like protein